MRRKLFAVAAAAAAIVAGAFAGYRIATDEGLRTRLCEKVKEATGLSRERVDTMTEEVALKTARLTRNPKINQDWVERQWDGLGL